VKGKFTMSATITAARSHPVVVQNHGDHPKAGNQHNAQTSSGVTPVNTNPDKQGKASTNIREHLLPPEPEVMCQLPARGKGPETTETTLLQTGGSKSADKLLTEKQLNRIINADKLSTEEKFNRAVQTLADAENFSRLAAAYTGNDDVRNGSNIITKEDFEAFRNHIQMLAAVGIDPSNQENKILNAIKFLENHEESFDTLDTANASRQQKTPVQIGRAHV
jgi:hypothetical protein